MCEIKFYFKYFKYFKNPMYDFPFGIKIEDYYDFKTLTLMISSSPLIVSAEHKIIGIRGNKR